MTKAEAITRLSQLSVGIARELDMRYVKAIDMAIEALRAQDVDGDTISRRAEINEIDRLIGEMRKSKYGTADFRKGVIDGYCRVLSWVRVEPPASARIIRCKDCKWFGDVGCAIQIVDETDRPKEWDFCSFAERKADG